MFMYVYLFVDVILILSQFRSCLDCSYTFMHTFTFCLLCSLDLYIGTLHKIINFRPETLRLVIKLERESV